MIVMGVDPGSVRTGFGVLEVRRFQGQVQVQANAFGVIQVAPERLFAERLGEIGDNFSQLLAKHRPQVVVLEKVFLGKNPDSAFKLGHTRGVLLYLAQSQNILVKEYATRQIKKSIAGKGSASKEEVQTWLEKMLRIDAISPLDASDALALAVHYAYDRADLLNSKGVTI